MKALEIAGATAQPKPIRDAPSPQTAPAVAASKPSRRAPEPSTAATTGLSKPKAGPSLPKPAGARRSAKPNERSPRPQSVVGHAATEAHKKIADDTPLGGGHSGGETQSRSAAPDLLNLRIFAEVFEDIQKQRIATTNRAERGGIDPVFLQPTLDRLTDAEKEAGKVMRRCYRTTVPQPIRDWQAAAIGIGEHLLARLLGIIGHPVRTTVYEWQGAGSERVLVEVGPMSRSISQLWSYCGHGDPTRRRKSGMSAAEAAAGGNPRAKMLAHLLAESCMKQRTSPYRVVYDEARMDYEEREWSDLHRHNAALRKTAKAILKDLWLAAGDAEAGEGATLLSKPIVKAPPRLIPPGGIHED